MKHHYDTVDNNFTCKHCKNFVTTDPDYSGVNNRNHCPYCLWSRHMDFFEPGDRLAACKMEMRPVGLTIKRTNKKYGNLGELMIIHQCVECGKISINRIAADDDNELLMKVFEESFTMPDTLAAALKKEGIARLGPEDTKLVRARVYGLNEE